MSRTLASWSFCFAKTNGGKGIWLLLPASLKPIVEKLSLNRQLEKNGKTVLRTLQEQPQLWETFLPLGTCQQIAEKMTGVVKTHFLLTVRTFRWYRRKPSPLWDAQGDVPHGANHPLSCSGGRGRGCWPESGYSLQIFEDAHGPCSLLMSSSEDSKQCPHKR